eukprot:CAMPEP_0184361186 /NCGR_PEP_ID=MMETSP1089-20130417/128935_1 /TAXON_ID=38269 ORGANISM="Gloeochaete wittrockiana, Strain SAG46.84" /NCGR_SAMPLE_ID=MMETSP1089 /ASSEMBLY_ACC=CAM_ASM_000445 /LENGTH=147 /DNA_ID=CAMNT_0026700729 /DNA_START=9 /DNA_END=452 /DNA_ORIENTATION=+
METLSQDQIAEFKEAFNNYSGGAETIDKATLGKALRDVGIKKSPEEVQEMIESASDDGRKVSFNEFLTHMTETMNALDDEKELLNAFECFDAGNTGTITHDAFRQVLLEGKINDKDIRELIKVGDVGEGKLDYGKLIKYMVSNAPTL